MRAARPFRRFSPFGPYRPFRFLLLGLLCIGWALAGDLGLGELRAQASSPTSLPDPEPAEVNSRVGLELLPLSGNFWEESDVAAAGRLGWPEESRTSTSSSFRSYAPVEFFGRKAYAMALQAEDAHPVALSLVFANKGDIQAMMGVDMKADGAAVKRDQARVLRDYKRIIAEDARILQEKLTELFGEPKKERTGGSAQTAEIGNRWDWRGHTFFLAAPRGEYVTLRMVPTASLDESGIERIARGDLRSTLTSRVQRSENGDVVITDIPMVDQGPKGYCVPATWERVMRYMGIPADMYVLAMAGGTDVGGGTSIQDIENGARQLVQRHGRRINSERMKLTPATIGRTIDQGIPLMWAMFSTDEFNQIANTRTRQRAAVTDWDVWKNETLAPAKRNARNIKTDRNSSHVCMIIGYNRETGEVAVSDSWGPGAALRWVLFEEADAVSQGVFTTILP